MALLAKLIKGWVYVKAAQSLWAWRRHATRDDPDPGESLAAVRGLGALREPALDAHIEAVNMDVTKQPDLRGPRDVDPDAPHPWRAP